LQAKDAEFKNYLAQVVDMSQLNMAHESAKANCKAAEQQQTNAQTQALGIKNQLQVHQGRVSFLFSASMDIAPLLICRSGI